MRTILCALLLSAVAAAQSFDELLPDTTVFYVSVENLARSRERFESGPLGALWEDEAMGAFLAKPRAAWTELMEKLRKDDGISPDDVLGVVSGQVALGVAFVEGSAEPLPLLLADIGGNGERFRELVSTIEKRLLEQQGYRREAEEFRGVEVVTYAKGEEGEEPTSWCLDGATFAMSKGAEHLKQMLVRKERKEEGTLASRELYRTTRGRAGARGGDLFFYVDAPNLWKAIQQEGEADEDTMRILGILGITSIESLAAGVAMEPKSLSCRIFMGMKGAKSGVLKLFDGKNSALLPPAYAPSDVLSAGSFALDIPALWEEARKVLDRIEEGTTMQMDAFLDNIKQNTGVDIAADIIAPLGAELNVCMTPAPPSEVQRNSLMGLGVAGLGRFTFALQVKDRERMEGALDKLLAMAGPAIATQEYLGVKVRAMQTPLGMAGMAMLADRLVVGLTVDEVKDVVARHGKEVQGLLDREDVAKALAALPGERMGVGIEDTARSFRTGFLAGLAEGLQGGETDFLDPTLFPSEDVLRKYIGLGASCFVNEPDGVSYLYILNLKANG